MKNIKRKTSLWILFFLILLSQPFCRKQESETRKNSEENSKQTSFDNKNLKNIESEFWYASNNDGVYIRKTPSTSSEPIRYALNEEIFEIIGKIDKIEKVNNKEGNWFLIKFYQGV